MKAKAGIKYDQGKTRFDLWPWRAFETVAKVITFGAEQYGVENWQELPDFERRFFGAAMRHLTAWKLGEKTDEKTGLPHLAHAACNVVFLLSKDLGFDPKPGQDP
jgi:hypothetical protein